jgi:hypothetical protein
MLVGIHTSPHRSGILHWHRFVSATEHSGSASNQVAPGKLWPTPPHRCHASIRTLNGPLQGPVQVGVRSNTQVHHCRDEPGIVGAAIYGEIFIDQRSKRSHPNKAVDVVVCQISWIESGSRFINSGPALHNKNAWRLSSRFRPLSPGRLGCRRNRPRHRVVQRLVHLSTHPQPV